MATAIAVRMDFISVPFISKLLKVLSGKNRTRRDFRPSLAAEG